MSAIDIDAMLVAADKAEAENGRVSVGPEWLREVAAELIAAGARDVVRVPLKRKAVR